MPDMHQRALAPAQVRFALDSEAGTFTGYAAVFNDLVPSYNERVLPGAFTRTLAERAARGDTLAILWAHDPREVIGVATSLREDAYGLRVEGRLILDIDRAREAHTLIREGVDSLSIGFYPVKWTRNDQGEYLIEDAELVEFSVVYAGASPRAKITEIRQIGDPTMPDPIAPETPAPIPAVPDMTAIEARMAEMQTRLDEFEIRSQRPGPQPREDEQREMRALASFLRTGNEAEMRAAATDSGPDGGWLVLPTVDTRIRDVVRDISPMRGLAEVVSTSSGTYERFYSVGNSGATWVSERESRPQDTNRPALKKHSFGVAELYACPAATRHQLEDAAVDISAWLINSASVDFSIAEGEAFLDGDGVDGSPRGLLTYDFSSAADFSRDWGAWQYIECNSNPLVTPLGDALVTLMMSLRTPYRANARWLMSRDTALKVRQLKDENGRFLWAPVGNLVEGEQGTLLGFPVSYDDGMPAMDTGDSPFESSYPIAFGDFRQGYVVVDRHGIRVERDAITTKGQVRFDTYKRVGGGAGDFNAIKFIKTVEA
ncbi:MAG: phage prohead protease, family/phage major capsid protein family [Devosia sp.]|uniref:phage major capsid protein n=1 Tax=Devosia sp. TaxID=1871048 RepID=UPI002602B054|nr:phage major capsid protein [Devosia sp.]MDB5541390.1 phage prohead protease, family/phage major capsid protein family [Devosia sp.]